MLCPIAVFIHFQILIKWKLCFPRALILYRIDYHLNLIDNCVNISLEKVILTSRVFLTHELYCADLIDASTFWGRNNETRPFSQSNLITKMWLKMLSRYLRCIWSCYIGINVMCTLCKVYVLKIWNKIIHELDTLRVILYAPSKECLNCKWASWREKYL